MPVKNTKAVVKEIKTLKIQGASKVREALVKAMGREARENPAKTIPALRKELRESLFLLASARPTEPGTRTAARIIIKAINGPAAGVPELRKMVSEACARYTKNREDALEKMAQYGANLIPKGSVVLTHCHSHSVEAILIKAKPKIKYVINTETRPRWQGRITSQSLAKAGLKVVHIVDSAAASFMGEANFFITGCDAILADGGIVNKIGTRQISLAAEKEGVPHYAASSTHSFDPVTYFGIPEKIEERDLREVWGKKIKGVSIRNPAFDITEGEYIDGIITERGVFAPETLALLMYEEMEVAKKKPKDFSLIRMLGK